MRSYAVHWLVAGMVIGCNSFKPPPIPTSSVVAELPIKTCIVDDKYIYGDGNGLVRISRRTGTVEPISSEVRDLRALALVMRRLYWLDDTGVHEWNNAVIGPTTIAKGEGQEPGRVDAMATLDHRVCWSVHTDEEFRADCLDVATGEVANWSTIPVEEFVATGRLVVFQGSFYSVHEEVRNGCIVHHLYPEMSGRFSSIGEPCGELATTAIGPAFLLAPGDYQRDGRGFPRRLWLPFERRNLTLPSNVVALRTVNGITYAFTPDQVFTVDMATGTITQIELPARPICGDDQALYGTKDGKFLQFQIPK